MYKLSSSYHDTLPIVLLSKSDLKLIHQIVTTS